MKQKQDRETSSWLDMLHGKQNIDYHWSKIVGKCLLRSMWLLSGSSASAWWESTMCPAGRLLKNLSLQLWRKQVSKLCRDRGCPISPGCKCLLVQMHLTFYWGHFEYQNQASSPELSLDISSKLNAVYLGILSLMTIRKSEMHWSYKIKLLLYDFASY